MSRTRIPPGVFILEEMAARGWTSDTLAEKAGMTRALMLDVLAGDHVIDETIAQCLSNAFGTSARLWLNLERAYREPLT